MKAVNDDIYINEPQLMSRRQRIGDAMATGLMWALYSYLWAPLVSLVEWLLGFEFAYDVMVRAGGLHVLEEVMYFYGLMIFADTQTSSSGGLFPSHPCYARWFLSALSCWLYRAAHPPVL